MPTITKNKKIFHDYEILEKYEAGIELLGHEVKSAKAGQAKLDGAYILFRHNEAYIVGAHIPRWRFSAPDATYDPTRKRRLLLKRKELDYLSGKSTVPGLTIKPISMYTTKHGLLKLEIAVVRGKKQFDKRETIKKRDLERESRQHLKLKTKGGH